MHRRASSAGFEIRLSLCVCRYAAQPSFLTEESNSRLSDNISCGVRFFSPIFVVMICNNAECVQASSQYLQSNLDSFINVRTLAKMVRFIRSDSPLNSRLYGKPVVSVIPLVFHVFFIAVNCSALSLCTLLNLDAEFFRLCSLVQIKIEGFIPTVQRFGNGIPVRCDFHRKKIFLTSIHGLINRTAYI